MLLLALLSLAFVALFYKELKLSTFDPALAKAQGFRPGFLHYALMILVSLVAVGAFNAVGSILVIAFFIIPPAAAYLLTDRLSLMLGASGLIGAAGAYWGYDLARGTLFGLVDLPGDFSSSISASMVLMIFAFFCLVLVASPKYGLVSGAVRRARQRRRFADQVVLGHVSHHQGTSEAAGELAVAGLERHFRWTQKQTDRIVGRLRARKYLVVADGKLELTPRGRRNLEEFRRELATEAGADGSVR
jgi:manganese/zinc/iron transport system permease protein